MKLGGPIFRLEGLWGFRGVVIILAVQHVVLLGLIEFDRVHGVASLVLDVLSGVFVL